MERPVEDLLAEFLELRERGAAPPPEDFLRAHPAQADALRRALAGLGLVEERLEGLGALHLGQLGRYRVVAEIARGGMGRVLRAVDPDRPDEPVALKQLDAALALGPRGRERFRREVEILRGLSHPGVVRVLDAGADEPVPWLAMELVEGETLAAVIARGRSDGARPFEARRAAEVVARLARAVEAVHAAGVLHRDIKPANAILAEDGRVVLVDFGLVREEGTATLTRTGDLVGTPQYMAPEQARGERADERTDVYGLGAVLYELLALRPPHVAREGTSDPLHLLAEVRARSAPRLRRLAPDVPAELERVVTRALAFRRAARTPSAAALARDLEAFLEGAPVAARAPSALERVDELWRVHKAKLPLAAGLALLVVAGVYVARVLDARADARGRALVEETLARFVARDEAGALAAAEELAALEPDGRFTPLLLSVARDEAPPAAEDPAAAAAARGWSALREDRPEEAVAALQEALALAPEELTTLVLLARAAELAGDDELAAREYRAAVERAPERDQLFARLSAVHYDRGDDVEAERAIRRAIELAPEESAHRFALSRVLGRMKRTEEALAAARRGEELAGEDATRLELQILSACLDQTGRYEEAREVLRRVLARWPGDRQALYNLAYSYQLDHHLVEAVEVCHELAETRSRSLALATLAWIHAGSDRESCEECAAAYAAAPGLYDPDRAEEVALEALAMDDSSNVPMVVASVGAALGRPERIGAALERLRSEAEGDARIALFERALRLLR